MDTWPDYVLSQIFEIMPLQQRKQVRLVCKRWNWAANIASITKQEKIVINHYNELSTMLDVLLESQRRIFNLEFYSHRLAHSQSQKFWILHGAKVRSLSFLDCSLSGKDELFHILRHCPNLTDVSVTFLTDKRYDEISFIKNLKNVYAQNFVAEKVSAFRLTLIHPASISNHNLNMIKIMFPRLVEFEISVKFFSPYFTKNVEDVSLSDPLLFTFEGVKHFVHSFGAQLKSLKLDFAAGNPSRQLSTDVINMVKNLTRLEKFQIFRLINNAPHRSVDQLWSLRHLTTLDFRHSYFGRHVYSFRDFVISALDSFPHLRHLSFGYFETINFDAAVLQRIMRSSLKTLKFPHAPRTRIVEEDIPKNLECNETLERISEAGFIHSSLWIVFVKFCKNLRHLRVSKPTDSVLQHIFKHQIGLRSLVLLDCKKCSDFGFTGIVSSEEAGQPTDSYSFHRLKELVRLKIIAKSEGLLTEQMFSSFKFPKLKYLHLNIHVDCENDDDDEVAYSWFKSFCTSMEQFQNLEFLEIKIPIPNTESLHMLCGLLNQNFRFIFIENGIKQKRLSYSQNELETLLTLFKTFESLRFINFDFRQVYRDVRDNRIYPSFGEKYRCIFTFYLGSKKISRIIR